MGFGRSEVVMKFTQTDGNPNTMCLRLNMLKIAEGATQKQRSASVFEQPLLGSGLAPCLVGHSSQVHAGHRVCQRWARHG